MYHNGIVAPGYSASLYCDLSAKIGIVILRNDSGSDDIAGIADEFLYKLTEAKSKKEHGRPVAEDGRSPALLSHSASSMTFLPLMGIGFIE